MFNVYWVALTLMVSLSDCFALVVSAFPSVQSPISTYAHADPNRLAQATQRRPRRRLGGRSGICIVSPGLLEQRNVIWSDRPLFLWQSDPETTHLQRLVLTDQEDKILWEKPLVATDQWAIYDGPTLQPGQFYTWRLEWRVQDVANSADYTFQLMPTEQRQPITVGLQALTQRLQTTGASAAAIASQQADYFLSQDEELWSDALNVLYAVRNPSSETIQRRQHWLDSTCGEGGRG